MYNKINVFLSFNIISIQKNPLSTPLASFLITTLTLSLCNVSLPCFSWKIVLYYFYINFSLSKFCSSNIKSTSAVQVPTVQFSALKNYVITVLSTWS